MYPGHFTSGLLLKTMEPRASSWGLMVGVGLLDWLYAVFVLFGLEGGNLVHIDCTWSHSLLTSLLWAALFAAIYRAQGCRIVAVMFVAVMSHWLLDVLSHHADMSLWPNSRIELGYARVTGGLAGWLEVTFTGAGCVWYVVAARRNRSFGRHWTAAVVLMGVLYTAEYLVVP